jgi:hypothetical protein
MGNRKDRSPFFLRYFGKADSSFRAFFCSRMGRHCDFAVSFAELVCVARIVVTVVSGIQ